MQPSTKTDSVAESLAFAVDAMPPLADTANLDPEQFAKANARALEIASQALARTLVPAHTAVDEVAPLYDSAEKIAHFFGPTGPGADPKIAQDKAFAEALVRDRGGK